MLNLSWAPRVAMVTDQAEASAEQTRPPLCTPLDPETRRWTLLVVAHSCLHLIVLMKLLATVFVVQVAEETVIVKIFLGITDYFNRGE